MNISDEGITLTLDLREERRARLTAYVEAGQIALIGLELAT